MNYKKNNVKVGIYNKHKFVRRVIGLVYYATGIIAIPFIAIQGAKPDHVVMGTIILSGGMYAIFALVSCMVQFGILPNLIPALGKMHWIDDLLYWVTGAEDADKLIEEI